MGGLRNFLAGLAATLSVFGGAAAVGQTVITEPLNQPSATGFWNTPLTGSSQVNRAAARLLVGAAATSDGTFWTSNCPSTCYGGFTDLDWLGQLFVAGTVGGDDMNFAEMAVLCDPNAAPAITATPIICGFFAAETKNSLSGSTPRALESITVNNATGGNNPGAWSYYLECHQVTGGGNCFGIEDEVRNILSAPTTWTPYNLPSGAIGLALGCGAGLSATGQFNCPVAMFVEANPMPFTAGVSFLPGSVAAVGGISYALELPATYAMAWFGTGNALLGDVYADSSGDFHLVTCCGGLFEVAGSEQLADGAQLQFGAGTAYLGGSSASNFVLFGVGGAEQARVTSTGMAIGTVITEGAGTLNVAGGYYDNGTAGVTCSGSPTASFAAAGGIVTHC
jgi:hypothetical protein